MNRISETIKKLFPSEFEELVPVEKHWWQKLDLRTFHRTWQLWLFGAMFVFLSLSAVYYYNILVVLETQVLTDNAQIETQLQRRKNLIINLAKTVRDYAEHERMMFRYMADTRAESLPTKKTSVQAGPLPNLAGIDTPSLPAGTAKDEAIGAINEDKMLNISGINPHDLEGALTRFMALAENYPELKLSSNFQKFMDALVDIENRIAERRMAYNDSCNIYTTYIRKFPQQLFATVFGFRDYPFVEVDKDVALFNKVEY